jgi:hypothetical protein
MGWAGEVDARLAASGGAPVAAISTAALSMLRMSMVSSFVGASIRRE